jgi:hypothetical protein
MLGINAEYPLYGIQTEFISPEKVRLYVGLKKRAIFRTRPVSFDCITPGKVHLSEFSNKIGIFVQFTRVYFVGPPIERTTVAVLSFFFRTTHHPTSSRESLTAHHHHSAMHHPTLPRESLTAHHHHSAMQRPSSLRESLTGNGRWSGWLLSRTTLHPPVEVPPHRPLPAIAGAVLPPEQART